MTRPRHQRQRWKRQGLDNRPKEYTTTTEASAEDRRRVQGIGYDDGGGSGWTKGPLDWQDNKVLVFLTIVFLIVTLSCFCLVVVFVLYIFHQIPFFCSLQEILSVLQSCRKYVCNKCTLTLRMYTVRTGEKKLRALIINKDIHKSLAR